MGFSWELPPLANGYGLGEREKISRSAGYGLGENISRSALGAPAQLAGAAYLPGISWPNSEGPVDSILVPGVMVDKSPRIVFATCVFTSEVACVKATRRRHSRVAGPFRW